MGLKRSCGEREGEGEVWIGSLEGGGDGVDIGTPMESRDISAIVTPPSIERLRQKI